MYNAKTLFYKEASLFKDFFMLYYLSELRDIFFGFNVFRYITFRSALAALVALIISFIAGRPLIRFLQRLNFGQVIRSDGPQSHFGKKGTPTMGGILIIISVGLAVLLCGRLNNPKIILLLISMVVLGGVGFLDDFLKIKLKNSKGVSGWYKLLIQAIVGLGVGLFLYFFDESTFMVKLAYHDDGTLVESVKHLIPSTTLFVPFFSDITINLKMLYIPFAMLIVMGMSNSVNLTDGLDGLAIGITIFSALAYTVFAYISGHQFLAGYLLIPHVANAGELSIFAAALVGAGMGFLWYNAHPAEVFMGDVGSLSIGGIFGVLAILLKQEILLLIVGGVYVIETASVIIQVVSYKLRKKRVFLMTPIHHHFELSGWAESKVVVRFWIIAAFLALVGIATLKIR